MANLLVGATGSVAAVRIPTLSNALAATGFNVRVVATEAACYFFDPAELAAGVLVRDADEWPCERYSRGDPVLHIELRRWADLLLIAPLDANTLAKLALGISDNCLTCVWRPWDATRPAILAPAMNTLMWQHPATARHLRQLAEDARLAPNETKDADRLVQTINSLSKSLQIVPPIEKELACGDVGIGGMAEVPDLVAAVTAMLS